MPNVARTLSERAFQAHDDKAMPKDTDTADFTLTEQQVVRGPHPVHQRHCADALRGRALRDEAGPGVAGAVDVPRGAGTARASSRLAG